MVIRVIETDTDGKPVEIPADIEDLQLFGRIPEVPEQEQEKK